MIVFKLDNPEKKCIIIVKKEYIMGNKPPVKRSEKYEEEGWEVIRESEGGTLLSIEIPEDTEEDQD